MRFLGGVAVIAASSLILTSNGLDNGLALTPAMGWNSWNHFWCGVSEPLVKATADQFIALGLNEVGYQYVNVDDCWQVSRDANGVIVADPDKFPSGMKGLAEYVHSKGLKFGLYSDAGELTCDKRPGSLTHEVIDAKTYASWNVDYLKYDNCYNDNLHPQPRYTTMRDALNATGRPIYYSMCEWGVEDPATWATDVGNSWRTTDDIGDNWKSMLHNLDENDKWASYAGPGHWNDPDMLEVGNGGMTFEEYKSHFSLWALVKSPLVIGCDLRNVSQEALTILKNKEVIAVNQDPLGIQGRRISSQDDLEVWYGPLSNKEIAVILFNRSNATAKINANFRQFGLDVTTKMHARDLWEQKDLGEFTGYIDSEVPSHGVTMFKLTPISKIVVS